MVAAEHIEGLTQSVPHAQASHKNAGRFSAHKVRTTQARQGQLRLVPAAVHQIMAIDRDREIAVMLIKHHLAAARGPGCGYSYSRLHGGILSSASGLDGCARRIDWIVSSSL